MYGETLDKMYTKIRRLGRLGQVWSALSGRSSRLLSLFGQLTMLVDDALQ